ncbi:uncharacterized protein LOC142229970 [Haematobia irritans]|uniref:uncharacterized protein LOC142229970 n=1 Tax=Haematobia irritans TaxID=7368 RepID=UPI003F500B4E
MEKQYNNKHGARHREFQDNQKVFVKVFKHNKSFWQPGVIKQRLGGVNYKVEVLDNDTTTNSTHNEVLNSSNNEVPPESLPSSDNSNNIEGHQPSPATFDNNVDFTMRNDNLQGTSPIPDYPRRSARVRKFPNYLNDYVHN